ncbi:uncharacterized protein HKW66_Vig0029230 [Vigna angularis]|uniref:Uncharacterized protein n=1 Tax=Phaseolus angularis TaxID=3914 RepID=A0A8T0L989_PHAAN|nr:uncharacterized protein HKW66_Vig0029230 [Vigna angularis]
MCPAYLHLHLQASSYTKQSPQLLLQRSLPTTPPSLRRKLRRPLRLGVDAMHVQFENGVEVVDLVELSGGEVAVLIFPEAMAAWRSFSLVLSLPPSELQVTGAAG